MSIPTINPSLTDLGALSTTIHKQGYAVLGTSDLLSLAGLDINELAAIRASWDDLPADQYLKDGGHYRRRRHSCFIVEGEQIRQTPHRAHWQSVEYNALHGGMNRWFEPILPTTLKNLTTAKLILGLAKVFTSIKSIATWYVEAHQFRIDTTDGIGRPTPEGAHRDGVDYVVVILVGRENVKGGESRVFETEGPNGQRFTLAEPWSVLLLDDERVIHESTPIQPIADGAHRDTYVLTFRSKGFQGES